MNTSTQNSSLLAQKQAYSLDGTARCARYAFGPNRLHLCGPDINSEVLAYIQEGVTDQGLTYILEGFKTLFPYLKQIAQTNRIADPFDEMVVEAYWLGNRLLDRIPAKTFYVHLNESFSLKKRSSVYSFKYLKNKLKQGAKMHHSFHVFNVWQRTGHSETSHTLESMDQCMVSWGKVISIDGPNISVLRRPLIIKSNKLVLGDPENTKIIRRLEDYSMTEELSVDDVISIHWGVPCEILKKEQLYNLKKYTSLSIALANQTL